MTNKRIEVGVVSPTVSNARSKSKNEESESGSLALEDTIRLCYCQFIPLSIGSSLLLFSWIPSISGCATGS